ncbi:MAG: DUF1801 domain-containing protein [Ginsengibacter sp.]
MKKEIEEYNDRQTTVDKQICDLLATVIDSQLTEAENKIWHAHPVWFLAGNPIVGYSKLKNFIKLMFWSGADFGDEKLKPGSGKFKDASTSYTSTDQVDITEIKSWLKKSQAIQWDYKNIVKRKGKLEKLK